MAVVGAWILENLVRPGGNFGPADKAVYQAERESLAAPIIQAGVGVAVEQVADRDVFADLAGVGRGREGTAVSSAPAWAGDGSGNGT